MQIGGALRYEQHKNEIYRFAVRGIERDRRFQADKSAHCFFQSLDPAVRNGDTVTQTGGTQFLTRKQAVENFAATDVPAVLKQQSHLLEYALLAAHIEVNQNVVIRK